MDSSNKALMAIGGREASRERRARMAQGKAALPINHERTRRESDRMVTASLATAPVSDSPPMDVFIAAARTDASALLNPGPTPGAESADARVLSGRDASRARRSAMAQGKTGLQQMVTTPYIHAPASASVAATVSESLPRIAGGGRMAAQTLRAHRARNGRGETAPSRPSGRLRSPKPLKYPPKVADSSTYSGQRVTGVHIGHGTNITGDEAGAEKQVTGTQYIGTESGFNPRDAVAKVGASRTPAGLIVTGTQVRSKVMITGDESHSSVRITGEADQTLDDDALDRREQGAYVSVQFERQNNPHGHTVFGTNLGRSIRSVGSRERVREKALEKSLGGLPISGTAVGRSVRVTGDEAGSCRSITGDQYLMPGKQQDLRGEPRRAWSATYARAGSAEKMEGRADPVTGSKVSISESWTRQRITGVDVEKNDDVTGDEYGTCAIVTGTPYVGPGQYEAYCGSEDAALRVTPGLSRGYRVSGDLPLNADHVTGTQRGAERSVTGTPYYRAASGTEEAVVTLESIHDSFSVRTPQREAQLRTGSVGVDVSAGEGRITGSFAAGEGKITGNQEFHFKPRSRTDDGKEKSRITGEGRVDGPHISGSAWTDHANVTGTEGYIAADRNPSERAGKPHGFAGTTLFKSKGKHDAPKQLVTGMVGWSAKSAAKVTLSGGAQG